MRRDRLGCALLGALTATLVACAGEPSGIEDDAEGWGEQSGEPGTARYRIDGEEVELRYRTIAGHRTFEGDILLDGEAEVGASSESEPGVATDPLFGVSSSSRLWPHGVIPYTIESSVSTPARVRTAIHTWEATGLRFVPRTTQRAYVAFLEEPGNGVCRAQVGYDGGRRYVNLRDTSRYTACNLGVVVHELGHTIGLWHEHTRPDRDSYVRILWSHVSADHRDAFEIMTSGARRIGAYDITSSMHYRSYTLTSDGAASITRRDGSVLLHDWATISRGDVAAIRALYFEGTPVPGPDAGPRDAGPRDAGPRDAGPRDAGPRDAGPRDAGPRDAGPRDAGPRDAGPRDAGPRVDTGREMALADGGAGSLGAPPDGAWGDAAIDASDDELGDPTDDGQTGEDYEIDRSLHSTCSAAPGRASSSAPHAIVLVLLFFTMRRTRRARSKG